MTYEIVGIDFETTDTNPATCGICQVSVIDVLSEDVIFNELCIPTAEISSEASKVHGWTRSKLIKSGAEDEGFVMQGIVDWLDDNAKVVVGYNNIHFDDKILARYWPRFMLGEVPTVDIMRLAYRKHSFPSFKLVDLFRELVGADSLDESQAHEATYDCILTAKIAKQVVGSDLENYFEAAQQLQQPVELNVMPFGKHRGKEIRRLSRRYMRYMLTLDINPDVAHTFREELKRREGNARSE